MSGTSKLIILGCGSSGGVPRLGNAWGQCDPENPKNRRRRCAVLVQRWTAKGATNVLVDTPPDIREQLLDTKVAGLDAVLFTHDHADHTHGIDDLRVLVYNMKRRIDSYADAATQASLIDRFGYCFKTPEGRDYPAILNAHEVALNREIRVSGNGGIVSCWPILQHHGSIDSLGFRFGNVAYSPDVSDLPEASLERLQNLDCWIVDALRYTRHPNHLSVDQALAWIERLKPKRAVLTHMHVDLDYEVLRAKLPPNVEPAYDGMEIEITG
ncbi:MAG: MBL fold metallo-hydrolase [Pseudomonadota bacterium]